MAEQKLRESGRNRIGGYQVEIVSATKDLTVRSPSGVTLLAHRSYTEVTEPIDTLLVAGGMEIWSAANSPALLD